MKIRTRIAALALAAAAVGGIAVAIPTAATAVPIAAGGATTQGLNVCHQEARRSNNPVCWFTPSNPSCIYYVTVCTRY